MDKLFAVFGKLVLVILVIGVLVGSGVYLGKKYMGSSQITPTPTLSGTQVVTPTTSVLDTTIPSPIKSANVRVAVNAGGAKPFSAYELSAFSDWTVTKRQDASVSLDTLTINKDGYQLIISQGPMGGGGCTFPEDKPQEMSTSLTNPVEISLLSGAILKRGKTQSSDANKDAYMVCGKAPDGNYGIFTDFGAITYSTPLNADAQVLAQMDAMVGSLQKQ